MKALITGAGGFCGAHLAEYLRREGAQVCSIGLRDGPEDVYGVKDITDVHGLAGVIIRARPDYVFHLAGISHTDDVSLFYRVNTSYGAALLQALRISGFGHIPVLLAGSSAEYGMVGPDDLPVTEDTPAHPVGHYGVSKLAQTMLGLTEASHGGKIVVARPFNIVGPGMPSHLVAQDFVNKLRHVAGKPDGATIDVGDLAPTRDFIDVGDVVEIYWRLIRAEDAYGQVVNVCSGYGISIGDLLEKIMRISGVRATPKADPKYFRPNNVPESYGSVEKLEKILGSIKITDIEDSLQRIVQAADM